VTVHVTSCPENVTIEVSDTGPGVPKELSARIFTDGFTTKPPDGRGHRGIGLALVHRLVSRAGGTITMDCSGPTTFTVMLPTKERGGIEVGA
jgi:two-component system CitB family sensor kinase